jgi:hypothetical protein
VIAADRAHPGHIPRAPIGGWARISRAPLFRIVDDAIAAT